MVLRPRYTPFAIALLFSAPSWPNALHHVHVQGVVHGDIKPSNVLLTPVGEPLLMDFNLSGNLASATSARGGTLPYMPPEQLRAFTSAVGPSASSYDARSDIFSLGVVLYELLTGRLPFALIGTNGSNADLAELLMDRQKVGCVPLRAINQSIPHSLARTVEQCLAWSPDRRFCSARELRDALAAEVRPLKQWKRKLLAHRRAAMRILFGGIITVVASTAYWATLDPPQIRHYAKGLEQQRSHNFEEAAIQFERALQAAPDFYVAKFELGRTQIALGHVEAAREIFFELADTVNDARSAAFVGYCRSLRHQDSLAIPWYQRAISSGCTCGEIHNNLAVAYDLGARSLSAKQKFDFIEAELELALAAIPESETVKFNWVDYELKRLPFDGRTISERAIRFADELQRLKPDCGPVCLQTADVYSAAFSEDPERLDQAVALLRPAFHLGHAPPRDALLNARSWAALRARPGFHVLLDEMGTLIEPTDRGASIPRLLEPGQCVVHTAATR